MYKRRDELIRVKIKNKYDRTKIIKKSEKSEEK